MRWAELFDDLQAQLEAVDAAALRGEVSDRTRREAALLGIGDRLAPAVGATLALSVAGAGTVHGVLRAHGGDWLLLQEGGRDVLVPLHALLGVTGLSRASAAPGSAGAVAQRLDLRWALRGLARDRAAVAPVLVDGSGLAGTLDRVGADHVELALHPPAEPRRASAVLQVRLVPLSALALVRSG